MMDPAALRSLLSATRYEPILAFDPHGLQLPSFIAVANGHKPAMDAWVRVETWHHFALAMAGLDLVYVADALFNRTDERLDAIAIDRFGSTRAALQHVPTAGAEAHVFVAKSHEARDRARASGWYPLLVGDVVIDKLPSDHERFGAALGYPECCQTFFRERNDWQKDNTWCAAAPDAGGVREGAWTSNGLLRHSPAGLVAHIPCSSNCSATMAAASELYGTIQEVAPSYAEAMRRHLAGVFLVLTEQRVFRLEDAAIRNGSCSYKAATAVNPTAADDPLIDLLSRGDSCYIENGCVFVDRCRSPRGAYQSRGDQHAPECAFLIQYS